MKTQRPTMIRNLTNVPNYSTIKEINVWILHVMYFSID